MAELALMAATTMGTTAAGSAAVALPWLSTAGSLSSIAAAGGSAGAIASVGSGLSVLSTLGTGLSLASMAADIFGGMSDGKAAAMQITEQAEQDFLNAKQEELMGLQENNDIKENLLQTIAAQRLAYSGAGVDISFGTPGALESNMTKQAEMQLGTSRDNSRLKTLARRREGYLKLSQRSQAQSKPVMAGISSAGNTLAGMVSNG
jgi:hypothetical protein